MLHTYLYLEVMIFMLGNNNTLILRSSFQREENVIILVVFNFQEYPISRTKENLKSTTFEDRYKLIVCTLWSVISVDNLSPKRDTLPC